jgi:hypothetical protein
MTAGVTSDWSTVTSVGRLWEVGEPPSGSVSRLLTHAMGRRRGVRAAWSGLLSVASKIQEDKRRGRAQPRLCSYGPSLTR